MTSFDPLVLTHLAELGRRWEHDLTIAFLHVLTVARLSKRQLEAEMSAGSKFGADRLDWRTNFGKS